MPATMRRDPVVRDDGARYKSKAAAARAAGVSGYFIGKAMGPDPVPVLGHTYAPASGEAEWLRYRGPTLAMGGVELRDGHCYRVAFAADGSWSLRDGWGGLCSAGDLPGRWETL